MKAGSAVVGVLLLVACSAESTGTTNDAGRVSWRATATGLYNSCAVAAGDGRIACWGLALRDACTSTGCRWLNRPHWLPTVPVVIDTLAASNGRYCGLTSPGDLYCWGAFTPVPGEPPAGETLRRIPLSEPARSLTVGYGHACVVLASAAAYCWGDNFSGQLGIGDTVRASSTPQPVAGALRFAMVSAGTTHSCGVTTNGEGYCWGGGFGALGVGVRDTSCVDAPSCVRTALPWQVAGDMRWRSISAGNAYSCGVSIEGRGYCWGALGFPPAPNLPYGVLGTGDYQGSKAPLPLVGNVPELRHIVTGTRHACALTTIGDAYCWGYNEGGLLGRGTTAGRSATPALVDGALRFRALTLSDYSCGVTATGAVYCWGPNAPGWLGLGSGVLSQPRPGRIAEPAG